MNMAISRKDNLMSSVWVSVSIVLFCISASANGATEAECTQKLLTFGLTLNNTPDCSGFLDAVSDITSTNCTYIAQDKRQFCWDTFAEPFGVILRDCQNVMDNGDGMNNGVDTQENGAEIDPCYSPEQYSSLLINALAGANNGSETSEAIACQNKMMTLAMSFQGDPRCTTFMDAFESEVCPINEADRDYCWQKFSGPVATFVEGCALHMDDENSSAEELKRDMYKNQCYSREQLAIFEDAINTAVKNSAYALGTSLIVGQFMFVLSMVLLLV